MKRAFLFVAILFAMVGCDEPTMVGGKPNLEVGKHYVGYGELSYIVFDGHEYVLMCDGKRGGITHSPKCECLKVKKNEEK